MPKAVLSLRDRYGNTLASFLPFINRLLEDAYLTRDPFSSAPHPLILGSHCSSCSKVVCVSPVCSVFYTKRFCTDCVLANQDEFPPQIQEVSKSAMFKYCPSIFMPCPQSQLELVSVFVLCVADGQQY